jgi:hypothetical protein
MIDIPRGKYKGDRVGAPVTDEAEHFIKCPACGGWRANSSASIQNNSGLPQGPADLPPGRLLMRQTVCAQRLHWYDRRRHLVVKIIRLSPAVMPVLCGVLC